MHTIIRTAGRERDTVPLRKLQVTKTRGAAITGFKISKVWLDEWSTILTDVFLAAATFENELFPDATIKIYERQLDKRDPRNRNPAAGKQLYWSVESGFTKPKPFYNLNQAKAYGKSLHERRVREQLEEQHAIERERAASPFYGRF